MSNKSSNLGDKGYLLEGFKQSEWYTFLDHGMRDLVSQTIELLFDEQEKHKERFHDYSFIVFPLAKAYEGFLKKVFFEMGVIDMESFESRQFRIGRSLNPDLPNKYRDESWLYDDLKERCGRKECQPLADEMWQAWQVGRNTLFHYFFPDHQNFISLRTARERVLLVVEVMEKVMRCGIVEVD